MTPRPPRLAEQLLAARLTSDWRDYVLGDLLEEFHIRAAVSVTAARRWYWAQALRCVAAPSAPVSRDSVPHRSRGLLMSTLWSNVVSAVRVFRRAPAYAAAVVTVLGLGIAANTAIFSLVNASLLRPLPFPKPDRLVRLYHVPPQDQFPGMPRFAVSAANFYDWQRDATSFERMAIYTFQQFTLTGLGDPESIVATSVGAGFFDVTGVAPEMGRTFVDAEDQPGGGRVVVVSDGFWSGHLGRDPRAVGRTLTLDGEAYRVVGIMPASFSNKVWGATSTDLWVPLAYTPERRLVRDNHNEAVIARLKPETTLPAAQAEMNAISRRLEQAYPAEDLGWGAAVVSLQGLLTEGLSSMFGMLMAAVGLLLLIASANVGNLTFTRALTRRKEIAIRAALGAGRRQVLQQLLTESLILALTGGALGLAVAYAALRAAAPMLIRQLPQAANLPFDWRVALFVAVVSIVAGVLSGAVPALRAGAHDLNDTLRQSGRADTGAFGLRTRRALIVGEVAMSLMLLFGAGVMLRSLAALRSADAGFNADHVLTFHVTLPESRYATPQARTAFFDRATEELRALPGVEAVGLIDDLPGNGGSIQPVVIAGGPAVAPRDQPTVAVRRITPGYLKALGIPLVRGRDLDARDGRVMLVSESAARLLWKDRDPIGAHVILPLTSKTDASEVLGIVGDVKQNDLSKGTTPTVYLFSRDRDWSSLSFALRTAVDPSQLSRAATRVILSLDPSQPVEDMLTMNGVMDGTVRTQRVTASLLGLFAAVALVLASVGIYTVLAYIVRGRNREIGIRSALGARASDVLRMVIVEGMLPAGAGVVVGIAGSLAAAGLLRRMVFGIAPSDPATLLGASGLLILVALLASAIPAYRASRVDPLKALRES